MATPANARFPAVSVHSKGELDYPKQICIAEWFEQESHSPLFKRRRAGAFILMSSDEDDRQVKTSKPQFSLKLESGHIRHRDVQNETVRLAHATGRQKFCRRGKDSGFEP